MHYLANLDEIEMLFKVFYAKWKQHVNDDWTTQVHQRIASKEW